MIAHNAERRLERCERIVGYLRSRARQRREQCRLSRVGKSHESHIRKQLQLEYDGHFLHRLTGLRESRSLVGGTAELEIAKSAASSLEQQHLLSVIGDVAHILSRLGVIHHRSARNVNINILSVLAVTLVPAAVSTVFGKHVTLIFKMQQSPVIVVAAQVYVGATSTFSRAAIYLHVIYKVGFCHILFSVC